MMGSVSSEPNIQYNALVRQNAFNLTLKSLVLNCSTTIECVKVKVLKPLMVKTTNKLQLFLYQSFKLGVFKRYFLRQNFATVLR